MILRPFCSLRAIFIAGAFYSDLLNVSEILVPVPELEHSPAADLKRGDRGRSLNTTCRGYCQGLQAAETSITINEGKDRFYTEKVFWASALKGSCQIMPCSVMWIEPSVTGTAHENRLGQMVVVCRSWE